jgi:DNA-binding MarR family transcriptional regulator
MSDSELSIALTKAQVDRLVREAAGAQSLSGLLAAGLDDPSALRDAALARMDDERLSRSLLRALLVLAAFPADGAERPLSDVAESLEMYPSTTHRYITTFVEVGLLERNPTSRKYRRPTSV